MSNWTHVAAVFRINDIVFATPEVRPNLDAVFGKECVLKTTSDEDLKVFCDEWKEMANNPEAYLPTGSEGSLHKSVWINPDSGATARYVVTIWGDLRDHDDVGGLEKWFKNCCGKLKGWLRQACITIDNDEKGLSKTIAYRFDEPIEDKKMNDCNATEPMICSEALTNNV